MAGRHVKTLSFSLGGGASAAGSGATRKRPRAAFDGDDAVVKERVTVRLVELIDELEKAEDAADLHFGLFLWPCALVLAHFVAFHHANRFKGRVALELGCGIALPGILAALCGDARKVLLSDRADSATIQRNVLANIELNGIAHVASYLPLNWGAHDLLDHVALLRGVDVILAADCFYQSEDFEKVLATVALVFRLNPSCSFITAYQLRSMNRSIAPLLQRYGMGHRILDKLAFMEADDVPGADSVFVYEIFPHRNADSLTA